MQAFEDAKIFGIELPPSKSKKDEDFVDKNPDGGAAGAATGEDTLSEVTDGQNPEKSFQSEKATVQTQQDEYTRKMLASAAAAVETEIMEKVHGKAV